MLQAHSLSAIPGIRHAFFTRAGGVSEGIYAGLNGGVGSNDLPDRVSENRTRMAAGVGVTPERFMSAYQIHSPTVVLVEKPWKPDERPRADGMVTREPLLALGIATADCGPVLFADPAARVIAAAHAGWKGALGGVLEATLDTMEAQGATRGSVVAAVGPMIQQRHYEVGDDLRDRFTGADAANARFFVAGQPGHAMFDLPGYIVARLERAGIAHIENLGLCTYGDPAQFYSYRRATHRGEPDYGRHISAIALAG